MKKIFAGILALAMLFTLAGCGAVVNQTADGSDVNQGSGGGSSGSAGEIKIVMGHAGSDSLADGIMSLKFNELIEEKSGGRIVVEYHTNDTLGDEDELLQQVINGSIQVSCCSLPSAVSWRPSRQC